MIDVRTHRLLWTLHKWAGIVAAGWLLVLGVTGVMLDHHEWKWLARTPIPSAWASDQVNKIVTPGTVMRHIAATPNAILGASERGTWLSTDRGRTWTPLAFAGLRSQPQVLGVAGAGGADFSRIVLASDDGLWTVAADGRSARRLGLAGETITAISPGHEAGSLVVVRDHTQLLTFDLATRRASAIASGGRATGLSETVAFNTVWREIHFGRGLLPGGWSVWLNDLGGVAMIVLSLSGIAYWLIKRRGKQMGLSAGARQGAMRWLFRFHAPVLGLLGALPILYLAVTAIPLNHIYGFLDKTRAWTVPRASAPPAYHGYLANEIDGVVAWPGEPGRLTISGRFGLLESRDNGRTWRADNSLGGRHNGLGANLFRIEDRVFVGAGRANFVKAPGDAAWRKLSGLPTAITSAAKVGDQWLIKNSRSIYTGPADATRFADTKITFRNAAPGTTLYLFAADIHTGVVFSKQFKWANDLFAGLAIVLVLSGPVIWLRRRWV